MPKPGLLFALALFTFGPGMVHVGPWSGLRLANTPRSGLLLAKVWFTVVCTNVSVVHTSLVWLTCCPGMVYLWPKPGLLVAKVWFTFL